MNMDLKGHLAARLDKVFDGTEYIFDDEFFMKQRFILNALDNV